MCLQAVGFAKLQMPRDADGRTDFTHPSVFAIATASTSSTTGHHQHTPPS